MYSQVKAFISQRVDIPDKELDEALQYASYREYSKGEYVIRIGEQCRFIGYINKGLMVTTTVDDSGKESAFDFKRENCFFTYTEGLLNNKPSHKNFIALEDCETLILQKDHLEQLFKTNPKFESLFSKILAEDLASVLANQQSMKEQSLEDRYFA